MSVGKENLPELRKTFTPKEECTDLSKIPRWVKTALVFVEVSGETIDAAAKRFGKKGNTLKRYNKSPAVKEWRASLREAADDPVVLANAVLKGHATNVVAEYLVALEQAIAATDYSEVARMSKDILDRIGITAKKEQRSVPSISITIEGAAEVIEVETEVIEDG